MPAEKLAENLEGMEITRDGDKMIISFDLSKDPRTSSTGKSLLLYTSHGFQWIDKKEIGVSLTVIKKKPR